MLCLFGQELVNWFESVWFVVLCSCLSLLFVLSLCLIVRGEGERLHDNFYCVSTRENVLECFRCDKFSRTTRFVRQAVSVSWDPRGRVAGNTFW